MISHYKPYSGFSLIELLVVLTISMTAITLVGGLSLDFIKKYQTQAEVKALTATLKKAGNLAFLAEQSIVVALAEKSLTIQSSEKVLMERSFEHIRFPQPTNFSFSGIGQPSIGEIGLIQNGRSTSLSLWTYLNAS